jgi:hypothetical protein
MFRNFSDKLGFNLFPKTSFGMNSFVSAYGKPRCSFWLNASQGLSTSTDLDLIDYWTDIVNGVRFAQTVPINKPRLLISDPTFGGNPVVDFNVSPKRLFSTRGINVGESQTIVNILPGRGGLRTILVLLEIMITRM